MRAPLVITPDTLPKDALTTADNVRFIALQNAECVVLRKLSADVVLEVAGALIETGHAVTIDAWGGENAEPVLDVYREVIARAKGNVA